MMGKEVDVDGIQSHLGTGRFQFLVFLVLGLIYSRGAWHVFGIMFLAGDPGHKCALPNNDTLAAFSLSPFHEIWYSTHQPETSSGSGGTHILTSSALPGSSGIEEENPDMPYIPQGEDGDKYTSKTNWTAKTCSVSYITEDNSSVTVLTDCPYGWTYGSVFDTTVLSEWDLVCTKNYLVELSMTVFMIGAMVGAMLILPMADRFGRKRVMMVCLLCQTCIGTGTAFVNNYTAFTVLRFIIGMINIGVGLCSYVLMTESFPAQRRTAMSIAFQAFWALGVMTVAAFGYMVRHWRHLELLLSLPNLLTLPCFWLLPESLPWLISQKRWSEALATVTTIAKVNRKDAKDVVCLLSSHGTSSDSASSAFSDNQSRVNGNGHAEAVGESEIDSMIDSEHTNHISAHGNGNGKLEAVKADKSKASGWALFSKDCEEMKSYTDCVGENSNRDMKLAFSGAVGDGNESSQQLTRSILELFRHPQMRRYSCVMFFLFFVNSLGYFGISFSVPVLHGNQFLNLAIMGAVEIPANIICIIVSQTIGRRYPNALFLLMCGISNIVAIFLPSDIEMLKLVFVMVGKFAITAAYSTIYLYSAEIFPTAIRNQAMGMSSVFENIGSVSAPFIVLAAKSLPQLPLVLFGVLTILGACLTLLLPETHNRPLPQTVQEITTW